MMSRCILLLFCLLMIKRVLNVTAQRNSIENQYSTVVLPESYNLWLIPFFENFTYWGKISVNFSATDSTNELILIGDHFELNDIVLTSLESGVTIETSLGDKTDLNNFIVLANGSLIGNYTIDITFNGVINNISINEGLFYNLYIVNEIDTFYVASGLRSDGKCDIFPCLNDPVTPVSVTVNVARLETQLSNSNTPIAISSLPDENIGGRVWDTYEATTHISPTEVGITVHELSAVAILEYSVFTNPEIIHQIDLAAAYLPKAADSLKYWLNSATLPFVKLDIVVLPDSSEEKTHLPGLVFCREDQILFGEGVSNANSKEEIVHSISNILTHQLFAEQLYKDRWLLEGIIIYLEYKMVSKLEDSWDSDGRFFTNIVQGALLEDTLDVDSSNKHKRVAAVFSMFENVIEEDVMKEVIHNLIRKRGLVLLEDVLESFSNTSVAENKMDFTEINGFSLFTILHTWILTPGYPIVEVEVSNSTITFTQKDVLQKQLTWPILIELSCELDLRRNTSVNAYWVSESQTTVEFPCNHSTELVLVNPRQKGYFRVNYDAAGWQGLTDQLRRNHTQLSAGMRSQLIDDAFQLARLGELEYSVVLALTEYLLNETDLVPWTTAARNIQQLVHLFHGTELSLDLQAHARDLISGFYNSTHRMFSAKDSHVKKKSRLHVLYWACHWHSPVCEDFTAVLFKQWLSSSVGFPAEYKYAAMCTGVQRFPESFYDVVDSLTQSQLDSDRRVHLTALSCTSNTTHLLYLLKTAFLSKSQMIFGYNDKLLLFQEIVKNPQNEPLVVGFFVQNYNLVNSRCGESLEQALWRSLGEACCSLESIQIVEQQVKNESLSMKLRENLNMSFVKGKQLLEERDKLAPLVSKALRLFSKPSTATLPAVSPSSNALLTTFNFNLVFICMIFAFTLKFVLKKI